MLSALKFVQGAVAKKDYQPALTHFRIRDGRVMGYNGTIALSSPIDLDLSATPQAIPFVKAIERCQKTTAIHMTPAGKLHLKSGKFKVTIECIEDSEVLDAIVPEGEHIDCAEFLHALNILRPYVAIDASRPWATGILLRGPSAFATNNIVLAEYWIGKVMPEVNLPTAAVNELIRINEEPSSVMIGERSMTFFFSGDRWLRTQLLVTTWPDVSQILDRDGDFQPFPDGLFDAVETLTPFVEETGRLHFRSGMVATSIDEGQGASVEVDGLPERGAFHYKHLLSLQGVATKIDFTQHPKPCPFRGDKLRGVILGMVDA